MIHQGTDAWFADRAGCVTASRIADVMAKLKSGAPAATRKNYMTQIVIERLTGKPDQSQSFESAAIRWGKETEPLARAAYEGKTGWMVEETGFVRHPSIPYAGCSPDGLIDETGLVEIKCPNTATHVETILSDSVDRDYILQMHWQMMCTGRKWCDFVSFDPRVPEKMQLYVRRFGLDEALASEIERDVRLFLGEAETMERALRGKFGIPKVEDF